MRRTLDNFGGNLKWGSGLPSPNLRLINDVQLLDAVIASDVHCLTLLVNSDHRVLFPVDTA